MIEFSWDPEYTNFILAVLWSVVGFASYYFLSRSESLAHIKIWKANPDLILRVNSVGAQRIWGLFFIGIISAILILLLLENPCRITDLDFHFSISAYGGHTCSIL